MSYYPGTDIGEGLEATCWSIGDDRVGIGERLDATCWSVGDDRVDVDVQLMPTIRL